MTIQSLQAAAWEQVPAFASDTAAVPGLRLQCCRAFVRVTPLCLTNDPYFWKVWLPEGVSHSLPPDSPSCSSNIRRAATAQHLFFAAGKVYTQAIVLTRLAWLSRGDLGAHDMAGRRPADTEVSCGLTSGPVWLLRRCQISKVLICACTSLVTRADVASTGGEHSKGGPAMLARQLNMLCTWTSTAQYHALGLISSCLFNATYALVLVAPG